jgi:iron complex outermembrane receptor protein
MKIKAFVCVVLLTGGFAAAKPGPLPAALASAGAVGETASIGAVGGHDTRAQRSPGAQPPYGELGEVVVTAEKRTTNLQQTPIAATVLTGVQLMHAGVVNVDQLETISPSVVVNDFGQGADFNIRGIGEGEHNTQTQPGVITYRDGVADLSLIPNEPYYDISSIQVLRGPQGTFAGENAIGGAVYIRETPPSFNGVHGYLVGQYGNYNDTMLQGAVNIPMTKTLASRLAFYEEYRNSFFRITGPYSGGNGTLKESAFRYSLLWQPSRSLSAIWRTDYAYIDSGGYPASPATAKTPLYDISANGPQLAINEIARSTLNVNYKMNDGITLRSISGVQYGRTSYNADLDGTARLNYVFKDQVPGLLYSQEFDLISPEEGFLTWVAGVYYQGLDYYYPIKTGFYIGFPPGIFDEYINGTVLNDTAATFGQLGFHFGRGVKFQLGARYSYNDSTNRVHIVIPEFSYDQPDHQTEHDDRVTGKAALSWTVDGGNYLYAFVATGYKQGGLNTPIGTQLQAPFRAEYVTDYELGWKTSALADRLRMQLDGYYDRYHNFQVTIADPVLPTQSLEVNNPSPTTLYGVEASLQAVVGHLSLDANAAINRSILGTFFANDPRVGGAAACLPLSGPASVSCVNLSGHPQTYAPKLTYNFGGQYVFYVPGGSTLTMRANYSHVGSQWATLFDNAALGDFLGARDLLSSQVAYGRGKWTFTAYGTNLTNEHYVSAMMSQLRYAGLPRQYGIRVMRVF